MMLLFREQNHYFFLIKFSKSDNQFFTHYGIMADVGASYLVSRDMRVLPM